MKFVTNTVPNLWMKNTAVKFNGYHVSAFTYTISKEIPAIFVHHFIAGYRGVSLLTPRGVNSI